MPTALKRFLRITPQQLRAFESAARLLSITKAAEELNVTQPTISVQLRELAEKVGQQLFTIENNKLKLTSAGEALVQTEAEVGQCWQRYEHRLFQLKGSTEQVLRLCAETGAEYFLPIWLRFFERDHPALKLDFYLGSRESALLKFKSGRYDFALVMDEPSLGEFERLTFYNSHLVVIGSEHHPLARSPKTVSLDNLKDDRWLCMGQSHRETDLSASASMVVDSYEAIYQCVSAGMGVAMVPIGVLKAGNDSSLMSGRPGIVQLNVEGFPKAQPWVVVWSRDKPLSAASNALVERLSNLDA